MKLILKAFLFFAITVVFSQTGLGQGLGTIIEVHNSDPTENSVERADVSYVNKNEAARLFYDATANLHDKIYIEKVVFTSEGDNSDTNAIFVYYSDETGSQSSYSFKEDYQPASCSKYTYSNGEFKQASCVDKNLLSTDPETLKTTSFLTQIKEEVIAPLAVEKLRLELTVDNLRKENSELKSANEVLQITCNKTNTEEDIQTENEYLITRNAELRAENARLKAEASK